MGKLGKDLEIVPWPKMFPKPFDLLGDGLRIVWAQRIIDGDKVIGAVIFNVEKGEGDEYGVVL